MHSCQPLVWTATSACPCAEHCEGEDLCDVQMGALHQWKSEARLSTSYIIFYGKKKNALAKLLYGHLVMWQKYL